ncbi:MAG: cytochrome c family protein [Amphiplicatus sp.]
MLMLMYRSRALQIAGLLLALFPTHSIAQQTAADGERVFRTQCGACHSVEAGQNRLGPHLAGIMGRKAGSVEGARYSPALKASTIVWNEETLATFLANPRELVPGTTMTIGVRNEDQRAAIIAYLKSLSEN